MFTKACKISVFAALGLSLVLSGIAQAQKTHNQTQSELFLKIENAMKGIKTVHATHWILYPEKDGTFKDTSKDEATCADKTENWYIPEIKSRFDSTSFLDIYNGSIRLRLDKHNNTYTAEKIDYRAPNLGCILEPFEIEYINTGALASETHSKSIYKGKNYPSVEFRINPYTYSYGHIRNPQHITIMTYPNKSWIRARIIDEYDPSGIKVICRHILEYEYNVPISEDMFTLVPPAGVKEVPDDSVKK